MWAATEANIDSDMAMAEGDAPARRESREGGGAGLAGRGRRRGLGAEAAGALNMPRLARELARARQKERLFKKKRRRKVVGRRARFSSEPRSEQPSTSRARGATRTQLAWKGVRDGAAETRPARSD